MKGDYDIPQGLGEEISNIMHVNQFKNLKNLLILEWIIST